MFFKNHAFIILLFIIFVNYVKNHSLISIASC